jgi:hypothetical protein
VLSLTGASEGLTLVVSLLGNREESSVRDITDPDIKI